ncbi:hypothetical protein PAAG_03421 [Paracoccidioides lutzii Pb01]|uniref:Uncharacterized protein n=1 Tax=Paracoccidioides lutzii (strain ATCC MYA-826 / Pb01) TaxID=502779 RepID=C1GX47_PARBA|nr:hypothetical protein PAAG_03421 [Paracoccidioides lutzii Pb01]EEH41135.2 hypothetical protein PAAG_03421 [Paracoccidioides lutzii Pb01]
MAAGDASSFFSSTVTSSLDRMHGRKVKQSMRLGVNHIDKEVKDNFYKKRIQSQRSLVQYNPDEILTRLHTQFHTPYPPPRVSSWIPVNLDPQDSWQCDSVGTAEQQD